MHQGAVHRQARAPGVLPRARHGQDHQHGPPGQRDRGHELPAQGAPVLRRGGTVYTYDPAKAKKLLTDAGVSDLSITLLTTDTSWVKDVAPLIKEDLDAVGISTTLDIGQSGGQYKKVDDGALDVMVAPATRRSSATTPTSCCAGGTRARCGRSSATAGPARPSSPRSHACSTPAPPSRTPRSRRKPGARSSTSSRTRSPLPAAAPQAPDGLGGLRAERVQAHPRHGSVLPGRLPHRLTSPCSG
ncbi:ABC transporter substrate-binding protein [Oerskovia sp. M15]